MQKSAFQDPRLMHISFRRILLLKSSDYQMVQFVTTTISADILCLVSWFLVDGWCNETDINVIFMAPSIRILIFTLIFQSHQQA